MTTRGPFYRLRAAQALDTPRLTPARCTHHYCQCIRADELAAMDRLDDAIQAHNTTVRCRLADLT